MGDFFRSAINYFSQTNNVAGGRVDHSLVNSTIKICGESFKIRSLLAEGGYALVFAVQDSQGSWYALKRQLAADHSAAEAIMQEIKIMKKLKGHPSIVTCLQATRLEPKNDKEEFLLLMELCSGGTLNDYLYKNVLSVKEVCKIFYSACSAVQHMHDRNPPITHRDIKIENLLFDSKGFVKLCDFGSATVNIYRPNDSWSVLKRSLLEEEMARFTTPMYRAPEILDLFQNYPIGPAQDVWALGCILYYLCYRQHPFEDSAKLRIINANYTLPDADLTNYAMFHTLIRNALQPNPYSRLSIYDLCEKVFDLSLVLKVDLSEPVLDPSTFKINERTANSNDVLCEKSEIENQAAEVFFQLKEQSLSLFKNFKDKSTAVMQNVQLPSSLTLNLTQQNNSNVRKKPPVPPPPSHCQQKPVIPTPPVQNFSQKLQQQNFFEERANDKKDNLFAKKKLDLTENITNDINKDDFWQQLKNEKLNKEKKKNLIENKPHNVLVDYTTNTEKENEINVGLDENDLLFLNNKEYKSYEIIDKKQKEFDPFGIFSDNLTTKNSEKHDYLNNNKYLNFFDDKHCETMQSKTENTVNELSKNTLTRNCVSAPTVEKMENNTLQNCLKNNPTNLVNLQQTDLSKNQNSTTINFDSFKYFLTNSSETASKNITSEKNDQLKSNCEKESKSSNNNNTSKLSSNTAFDDLLSSQGFSISSKSTNQTLADLRFKEEIKNLDPIEIKIREWTNGKERNIRALLGSLSNVLWEDAVMRWTQPSMAELLSYVQIKKHYRKACLIVHPDKQIGKPNETLAKAVFTELNNAWTTFEENCVK